MTVLWQKVRKFGSKVLEQRNQQLESTTSRKTLLSELKVCSKTRNLQRGKEIHAGAAKRGDDTCIYVATALVNMYTKCGSMIDARHVFDSMRHPDVVLWNSLILGYAQNGEGIVALDLFAKMNCAADRITILAALKACTSFVKKNGSGRDECLKRGKQIHLKINSQINFRADIYVQSTLIDMYTKCGSMVDARQVFDRIEKPDVVCWTALILGYADNGEGATALDLFGKMRSGDCAPNSVTIIAALKACSSLALEQDGIRRAECLKWGKLIHSENRHFLDINVQNSLIDMYTKCGSMVEAHTVFNDVRHPNVVSWNTLILGYARNGDGAASLDLFEKMVSRGYAPDSITFVSAIKACTSLALEQDGSGRAHSLQRGRQIHLSITCPLDMYVKSTLVDMYSKCGSMVDARQVFDSIDKPDVVCWSALILGYADNGEGATALDLFAKMRYQDCTPNSITIIGALKACTSLSLDDARKAECLQRGKQIHLENACHLDVNVQNNLIDMYAKCGSMDDAKQVFDCLRHPNVVAWNTLILGYAKNGEGSTALNLFETMKSQGYAPDSITFAAAFKACGMLGALECGSKIHAEIPSGTEDTILVTCLVDFYAKCGSLTDAQNVFDLHPHTRTQTTWNALLAGYSRLGEKEAVFELFEGIQDAGYQPDGVTFLCVLTCCNHAGLVDKANELFKAMSTKFEILPSIGHYTCMVDVLARSYKLDDAMALLRSMTCRSNSWAWMTVLGSCHKWKNVGIGRLAFLSLVSLDDTHGAPYVLMGQIYRTRGMFDEQNIVLGMREKVKACKVVGQSWWTNEFGKVHMFDGEIMHNSESHNSKKVETQVLNFPNML